MFLVAGANEHARLTVWAEAPPFNLHPLYPHSHLEPRKGNKVLDR